MASFDAEEKIFSGEKFPQIYHDEVPLGQVLLYNCLKYSDKVIHIYGDSGVKLTCGQMSDLMKRVAIRLQKFNLQFGDVVGFVAANSTFLAPAVFGCVLLGLPINPLSVTLEIEVIVKVCKQTKPKLVFCDVAQVAKMREVLQTLKFEARIVTLDGKVEAFDYIEEYFEGSENVGNFNSIPRKFHLTSDKVCVAIMTSSGSTGTPKLIQISHAQMLDSLLAFNGFDDNTLLFSDLPLSWISGFCHMVHSILNQHALLITGKKLSPKELTEWIIKYKPTQFGLVPSDITALHEYLKSHATDMTSIRMIPTGGWPVSVDTIKQIESFLPNGRVLITYGLTEAAGTVARTDFNEHSSAAAGKLCPNVQARIPLENGSIGSIGDVGEILLKIPFNFLGYLNDDEKTKAFIDDDSWIHTDDIGYFDENLNLFFVGRKKFMIRCFDHLVSPTEIEEIIALLPGVRKVCVVALSDCLAVTDTYYVPCAVVERSSMSVITEKEIIDAVSHLESFKHLRGGVFFVEGLPLTATGKLNRYEIEILAISMAKMG